MTVHHAAVRSTIERCRRALLAPTDRAEVTDVLRVEAFRRRVLADRTPMVHDEGPEDIGAWAERSAVPLPFGRILYRIARAVGGPIVEIGTGSGASTAYLAAGIARSGGGSISSLDQNLALIKRVQRHLEMEGFDDIAIHHGDQDEDALRLFTKTPPALVHIDSDHRYHTTNALLKNIVAACTEPTVVCLDDIRWSAEMERVWTEILHGRHATVHAFDLDLWGTVVISPGDSVSCTVERLDPPRGLAAATIANALVPQGQGLGRDDRFQQPVRGGRP